MSYPDESRGASRGSPGASNGTIADQSVRRPNLEALAEKLFSSLLRDDYDKVATCFSAGATWWIGGNLRGPASDFLAARRVQKHPIGPRTYEEVRRMFSDDGFVEQHVTQWIGAHGEVRRLPICAIVRVNSEGLVTTFEEYYDTAAINAR